jgi:hypothetical protein
MSTRRYIIDELGGRIGVLLDQEEYQQLTCFTPSDPDLLVGLSEAELQALAHSALAPAEQERLVTSWPGMPTGGFPRQIRPHSIICSIISIS